jgi:phosphatidylethanolamine/phosphatidyl-N-methylethanolamine N-methyltransferase
MRGHRLRRDAKTEAKRIGAYLADEVKVLRTWASKPLTTGAVSPSGRALARAMASEIDPAWPGVVVELGPGTGAVTAAILERGVDPRRLVAIEYNPDFAAHLAQRFAGVRVIEGDAYSLHRTLALHDVGPVAAVVSSLPLFTRPPRQRHELLAQSMGMLDPDRPFVQFSYALVPPVPPEPEAWTLSSSDWILMNLPPARVWTYRKLPLRS